MNDPIHIPSFILEIIEKLEKNGFEAYLVGGVIRDHMLGTSTKDYDISSSATPNQIKKVFKNNKFLDYGEKHGTISILYKQEVIEITTFREETSYSDGRRPDKINFIKDLRSDLSRRDFTINAMAATKDGNIIDYFGGKNDFKAKIIRTVGEAVERFSEDSLRMFRAIRFAVRLNFSIEKETFDAIKQNANLIIRHKISSERITGELLEILRFPKQGIQYLDNSNLLHVLMPEIYSNNTIEQIRKFNIPEKTNFAEFGFAILLSQIRSTSMRNSILSRFLGLNKKQVFSIYQLSQHSVIPTDIIEHPTKAMIRRWLTKTTKEFNGNRASLNQEDYLYLLFDLIKLQHHDNDLIEIINKIQIASYNLLSILNTQLAINGKVVESFGY
ncbi:MAG: hypothetical protein OEZ01_09510, partial [Candidatus Heimdallarchaeota archaeon]|nr:hypothetical protein [Candidatus Heimdallarchaeota archaeon]